MLAYVTMMLNYHRLCLQSYPLPLPLSLAELGQVTQQIGAFQVRVQSSLAQVLFTTLQQSQFWTGWAFWTDQVVNQWDQQPPALCQTLGLLPLQDQAADWTWKQGLVIQAMTLRAAQALMRTFPPEAMTAEALEQLLGLQEALVEDSSSVDPRGFERVPLGLPLLPTMVGAITVMRGEDDPALKRLPILSVQGCLQSAMVVPVTRILGEWIEAIARRLGESMAAVGLRLMAQMDQMERPWQDAITIPGEADWVRRVGLLCQSQIHWQEWDLSQEQIRQQTGPVWLLTHSYLSHQLRLKSLPTLDYASGAMMAARVRVAPGEWCDRWISRYGTTVVAQLQQLSCVARQILVLEDDSLALAIAIASAGRFWLGEDPRTTVAALLSGLEPMDWGRVGQEGRWRRFCQAWSEILGRLSRLGWHVSGGLIETQMDWDDLEQVHVSIQVVPQAVSRVAAPDSRGMSPMSPPERGRSREQMRQISSQMLARALARRGMSQAKLARSLVLDRSTVNRWINGSRPIHPRYRPLLWELLGTALQEE